MFGIKIWSAVLAMSAMACATTASTPSIYYKTQAQADAALAAFDKDNPDCQLWTNWQKMCSRTGLNGQTHCNIDPDKPVKPSVPFCAHRLTYKEGDIFSHEPEIPEILTEDKQSANSRNRFCNKFSNGNLEDYGLDEDMVALHKDKQRCITYKVTRPFNGMSAISQKNPRCKKWDQVKNGSFYCVETVSDDKCWNVTNGIYPPSATKDGIWVPGSRDSLLSRSAIIGMSCSEWRVKP